MDEVNKSGPYFEAVSLCYFNGSDSLWRWTRVADIENGELFGIHRIRQQPHRPFKRACRTNIFAKARHREALHAVCQRNANSKYRKNHVFEVGKPMGETALFDLRRWNLVEQLLNQPQWAEPATNSAPQRQAVKHQNTTHIPWRPLIHGSQCILQRSQRTRANRARARIAVEARHAEILHRAGINIPFDETLDVGIIEQRGIHLNQPPFGGLMRRPPRAYLLSQGQYTPYKY